MEYWRDRKGLCRWLLDGMAVLWSEGEVGGAKLNDMVKVAGHWRRLKQSLWNAEQHCQQMIDSWEGRGRVRGRRSRGGK